MSGSLLFTFRMLLAGLLITAAFGCSTDDDDDGGGFSGSPSVADYGDAPDQLPTGYPAGYAVTGEFPTLYASDGARTLSAEQGRLGLAVSAEEDADDPSDPDGIQNLTNTDGDDGLVDFVLALTSIPPTASLSVRVSNPTGSGQTSYYLNALIDLDMDGSWGGTAAGGEPEWVVRNLGVSISAGDTMTVDAPAFAYANGAVLPDSAWMRLALTKESIGTGDWRGTGEFSSGEIEDHMVMMPAMKMLVVTHDGPYTFPRGVSTIPVRVTVTNYGRASGQFSWDVVRATGTGVDLAPFAGFNLPINAAPPAPPPPPNPVVVNLTADRVVGSMPCVWKFRLHPDPEARIVPEGVVAGHGEIATDLHFTDEEPSVPVISLDGEYELIEFEHDYNPGTSPCVEMIGTFMVTNDGTGELEWRVAEETYVADWLILEPTGGTAPTTVTISFNCEGIYGLGGHNSFQIVGRDPTTGSEAQNEPAVIVEWETTQ